MTAKSTVLTNTYTVEYDLEAAQRLEEVTLDHLLDDEDDIVSTAIFAYNVNESFGDEVEFTVYKVRQTTIRRAECEPEAREYVDDYWVSYDQVSDGELCLAAVRVKVRACTVRM